MAVSRSDIVATARGYLGVPYVHQGRTRHGLDCIGLVVRVAHDLGLSDYDIDGYGRVPSGRLMVRLLTEQCHALRPSSAADIGDILHLAFSEQPQHLAIVTDRGIIHADNQRGVVEHRLDDRWRHRRRAAYRLPGVE